MATASAQGVYNVWIVGSNTVYRGVPFTVVCDWIQEGRLLPRDCVRTPDEQNWHYLSDMGLFQPYFPQKDTMPKADDAAEAYAPIEMEFQPREGEAEDEDPDMIPLIDISMVLLVFFMMTSSALLADSPDVAIPEAKVAYAAEKQGSLFVTVLFNKTKEYRYRIGAPEKGVSEAERNRWKTGVTQDQLEAALDTGLNKVRKEFRGEVKKVIITADKDVPFEVIQSKLQIPIEQQRNLKVEFKVNFQPGSGDASSAGGSP